MPSTKFVMSIRPYIQLARPDHWFKNIFIVPGVLVAFFFEPSLQWSAVWPGIIGGILAACVIASSYYVLNEILDAPYDRHHPDKQSRPLPSGRARIPVAWAWYVVLSIVALTASFLINRAFGWTGLLLWIMGALYNVPPIRTKDIPYGDVLSESLNNPIRLALGWYSTGIGSAPPLSLFIAYWMFGAFLMAAKRFAEYRNIDDPARAARYRKSFGHYTQEKLMVSIMYYATLFALMGGYFIARYRFELILATPAVAYCMAYYLHMAYKPNSPVQQPEHLFRHKKLMLAVSMTFILCAALLFINMDSLRSFFTPWIPPPD